MGKETEISWCDSTFNPWMGCTKVSPACKHCYAERDMDHRHGKVAWGPNGTRVLTTTTWPKPIQWNKEAAKSGKRLRVFCASLADVFEDWKGPIVKADGQVLWFQREGDWDSVLPWSLCGNRTGAVQVTMHHIRERLFKLIDATPNLDWLLLTKRPENILRMLPYRIGSPPPAHDGRWRPNVWLGTSVESQEYADKRIPELLKCRDLSPVLFLSCEPLVGPVDLRPALWLEDQYFGLRSKMTRAIDWVITGGESGPESRPNHPNWFCDLRDQAAAARVPFHFKQWGEWAPGTVAKNVPHAAMLINGMYCTPDSREAREALNREVNGEWNRLQATVMARVGKKAAGRMLDGVEHLAFPEHLKLMVGASP
jgi:protein gp37